MRRDISIRHLSSEGKYRTIAIYLFQSNQVLELTGHVLDYINKNERRCESSRTVTCKDSEGYMRKFLIVTEYQSRGQPYVWVGEYRD